MALNDGFYRTQEDPIIKLDALIDTLRRFRGCDFDVAVRAGDTESIIVSIGRETDESRTVVLRTPVAEPVDPPAATVRPAVFDPEHYPDDAVALFVQQLLSHWFAQGGEAQFGKISGENADELISSILQVVRKQIPTL